MNPTTFELLLSWVGYILETLYNVVKLQLQLKDTAVLLDTWLLEMLTTVG